MFCEKYILIKKKAKNCLLKMATKVWSNGIVHLEKGTK